MDLPKHSVLLTKFYVGKSKTQIDYILIRHRNFLIVIDNKALLYRANAPKYQSLIAVLLIKPPLK